VCKEEICLTCFGAHEVAAGAVYCSPLKYQRMINRCTDL